MDVAPWKSAVMTWLTVRSIKKHTAGKTCILPQTISWNFRMCIKPSPAHCCESPPSVWHASTNIWHSLCVFMWCTKHVNLSTEAQTHTHTYRHTGRESEETQVLSKDSHIPAGEPTFIWAPFIRFICSFELSWNNFSSRLTCSGSHASSEARLIPSQHGITYGINGSCCHVSIYLPGLRVTSAGAIISPVRLQYFFLCQLRALGISQASLDEIRFLPLLKRLFALLLWRLPLESEVIFLKEQSPG